MTPEPNHKLVTLREIKRTNFSPEPKTLSEIADDWENQALEQADIQEIKRTPEPKTDEVENLILQFTEEFISDRGYGVGPQYVPAQFDFSDDTDWLRTTLQTQADKAKREQREALEEYKQFILNVLDGVDIADENMGNTHGGTLAIRHAIKSRII